MKSRRIVAALVAIVLAIVGAGLLMSYIGAADQRALNGIKTTTVLVAAAPIPKGTAASALPDLVTTKAIPKVAAGPGVLTGLDPVKGKVATADFVPGEQLLASRFSDPESLDDSSQKQIPDGMQQVSLLLDAQRVLGGQLTAGATVGVFFTVGDETRLALHKVLVTTVQGGLTAAAPAKDGSAATAPPPLPAGSVMVTLALKARDAVAVVYMAEHGTLWLSLEPAGASEKGADPVTGDSVFG